MTRKEEIIQKANEMIPIELVPFKKYFIRGAEWADKHPRNGLVDVDEVCQYLESILLDYAGYYCDNEVIEKLRKVLKKFI